MTSMFGGGTTTENSQTNSSQSTSPNSYMVPYLQNLMTQAGNTYASQQGTQYPSADQLYAQMNGTQGQGLGMLNGTATGIGTSAPTGQVNAGTAAMNNGFAQGGAIGNAIMNTINGGANGVLANARMFANNPYTQSEINSANAPIEQELTENALPANNMAAAATGNTDGSRPAISQAILQRSAGTQEANNAANINSTNYETGLNIANSLYGNTLMGGAMGMNGATNLGTAGSGALSSGLSGLYNAGNTNFQVGSQYQNDSQQTDNAILQSLQGNLQMPYQLMSPLWSMASSGALGQNTTGQSTTNGSVTQPSNVIGGLLGTATGLGSMFSSGGLFGSGSSLASMLGLGGSSSGLLGGNLANTALGGSAGFGF